MKNISKIIMSLLLLLPAGAQASATTPYLEVTYTVKIPVVSMVDIQSPNQMYDTWNNLRSSLYGDFRNDPSDILSSQAYNSTNRFIFTRPFFTFDTSAIPDDAVIASSSLKLYVEGKLDQVNNPSSYFAILQGTPASSTAFSVYDYNDCGTLNNPVLGSAMYDTSNLPSSGFHGFDLNVSGKSWLNKTGYTTLCMRDGHDIDNQSYTSNNAWKSNLLQYSND